MTKGDIMNNFFKMQQLLTMFELQGEANDVMSDAWRTSKNGDPSEGRISYYRAAMMEAFEASAHLGFKWWKKEKPNLEQAKLELIDMLHFALSDVYRTYYTVVNENVFSGTLEEFLETRQENRSFDLTKSRSDITLEDYRNALEYTCVELKRTESVRVSDIIPLFILFDMGADEVYNLYVGKNTLNKFRNANGQRQGIYHKEWFGKEDNDSLMEYLNTLESAVSIDDLNQYLTNTYRNAKSVAGLQ